MRAADWNFIATRSLIEKIEDLKRLIASRNPPQNHQPGHEQQGNDISRSSSWPHTTPKGQA
jgi:hypothetical protein